MSLLAAPNGADLMGHTCVDAITGFTGVLTGYCSYLSGCHQGLLVPKVDADGKPRDGQWFDIQRLKVCPDVDRVVLDNGSTPGCDIPAPVR